MALLPRRFVWPLLLLLPSAAHAQIIPAGVLPGCNFLNGDMTTACIPSFIGYLVQLLISLIGGFFVINILIAGYQITIGHITGKGTEPGMNRLRSSVVGFAVAVLVFVIFDVAINLIIGL